MTFETISNISQIIFADIILLGDNALIIGMSACGLAPEQRKRAIMLGKYHSGGRSQHQLLGLHGDSSVRRMC